ncbi:MAG: hypothetical protein PHH83_04095 [Patescibacteria group bacterium]|nr:hypothetical protein [Patescibacteria group bacterium]
MEKYKNINNELQEKVVDLESQDREHFDIFVISALEKHSRKIDEGSRGIILKVDLSGFSDKELEDFGIKINREAGSVFKILKIENSVYAKYEHKMQSRAVEILNTEESKENGLASVPNVSRCDDIDISGNEKVINLLKKAGVDVSSDNKINVITMDYVPGMDLSFYIFRKIVEKILEKEINNVFIKQEINENPNEWLSVAGFSDLCRLMGIYFGIEFSTDNMHIIRKNEKILLDYMEKNDVTLNKGIFEVFRKSVIKLHENDFYHNDLHERNVRVVLDENDNLMQMYFIDFADASDFEDSNKPNDLSIYGVYCEHTITKQEKKNKKQKELLFNFDRDYELFQDAHPLSVAKVKGITYVFSGDKKDNMNNVLYSLNQELISDRENYVAISLILAIKNGQLDRKYVQDIINIGLLSPGPSFKWKIVNNILLTKNII